MPRANAEQDYIMYMHPRGRIHGTAIHVIQQPSAFVFFC